MGSAVSSISSFFTEEEYFNHMVQADADLSESQPAVLPGNISVRSVVSGTVCGIGSLLVVYTTTWILISHRVSEQFEGAVPTWTGVAWYVYNAHFIGLESTDGFGPFEADATTNLLALSVAFETDVLFVLPPVLLLIAGAVGCLALGRNTLVRDRLHVGFSLTAVYTGTMIFGLFFTEYHVEGVVFGIEGVSETVSPDPVRGILITIIYPLLFATTGSYVVGEFR